MPTGPDDVRFRGKTGSSRPDGQHDAIDPERTSDVMWSPLFAVRVSGVSGGNETQGWRDPPAPRRSVPGNSVGELSDGNNDASRKPFALRVDRGAECRTELKSHHARAFGCPIPRRSLAGEGGLLAREARLVAKYCTRTAPARQTVTRGDRTDSPSIVR